MPQYRFTPTRAGKLWWAIFTVAALLLALPTVINLFLPEREGGTDEVRFGSLGYEWEIPLRDARGELVSCSRSSNVIFGYLWDCEGTMVHSIVAEGAEDEEATLRRMMRAHLGSFPPRDALAFREEGSRMVIDPRYGAVGISLVGTGDQAGQSMIVLVYGGPEVPELADSVWFQFSRQPLPPPVLQLLDSLSPTWPGTSPDAPGELQMENV